MPNLQVPSNLNQSAQAVTDGTNNSPLSLTRSPLSPTNSEIGRVGIAAATPAGLLQLADSYVVAPAPTQNTAIDKPNIDAAISAVGGHAGFAGTVYLQAGEYVIDGTISLDLIGGINIIGAGAGCTIIRMNNTTGTVVFDISRNSLCTIKNLTLNSTQTSYIHTGIQVRSSASHATVEKVEILNMDKGVLLTSGSCLNNFRDVKIQNCNTGVKVGESGDANWSNVNRFWGCMVNDFTTNGVWFANGQDNVLYGVNIAGTTGAAPAVNFEALGSLSLGNRMYGCYLDNASGWIRINSNGNTIMNCQIGVGITWVSGTGPNSGNVVFGNLFVGQPFKEVILSNVCIGATPSDTDGKLYVINSQAHNRIKCYSYASGNYFTTLQMCRSKSNTVGTKTTTADLDGLGLIEWFGVNANATPAFEKGAQIVVSQDGSAGTTYVPAMMGFNVASTTGLATAMAIRSSTAVGIGQTSPASGLHLGASAGGSNKGYITEENIGQTPTLTVDGQMAIYSKGNKICIAKRVSGTTRYTSIDMSGTGNSWSPSTTTAP
jgi:hypothetical protein